MTERDLSTLVRDHATTDEPPFVLSADNVIGSGRRRVRARRAVAGVASVAVLAAVGVGVLPWVIDGVDGVDQDPAGASAEYDAARMPQLLADTTREVYGRTVSDLQEPEVQVIDKANRLLPRGRYDEAYEMSARYRLDEGRLLTGSLAWYHHDWDDYERICQERLASGYQLECDVRRAPDGTAYVVQATAMQESENPCGPLEPGMQCDPSLRLKGPKAAEPDFPPFSMESVASEDLDDADPDKLWFGFSITAFRTDGGEYRVTATEVLQSPTLARAESERLLSDEQLTEIVLDPDLGLNPPTGS